MFGRHRAQGGRIPIIRKYRCLFGTELKNRLGEKTPCFTFRSLSGPMCSVARRDVRHMHQHLLRAVHVEHVAAGAHFIKRLHGLPGPWLAAPAVCRHPTVHTSVRSNRAHGTMPENRPRYASIRTPAMRIRNRRGHLRRSRRCRTDVRPDRNEVVRSDQVTRIDRTRTRRS